MDFIENIVVGTGVLGLAAARELQYINKEVLLIERSKHIFNETSSRNSEVIHSGLYYEQNTYKNLFCLEGKNRLYKYLKDRNIPYRRCGKLIISDGTKHQNNILDSLVKKAEEKELDYKNLSKKTLKNKYSFLRSGENIFIEDSGIFDSHSYGLSLLADFENSGGLINFGNEIDKFTKSKSKIILHFRNSEYKISCINLVICAGLGSINILQKSDFSMQLPDQVLNKGDYFSYSGKVKVNELIYPIPTEHSLGLHLTPGLDGRIKFGPDNEFVDTLDYKVSPEKKGDFLSQIRTYIPKIKLSEIHPDYSGIRPKIMIEGKIFKDFFPVFEKDGDVTVSSILGYESPGLTSSMAAGKYLMEVINGG